MSNLLKSKFLLGVMLVAVLVVGGVAFLANTASADCSITSTLRVGSVGDEVKCLQTLVGATADGAFGPLTKASVMAWQSQRGLMPDGVFGPLSRAAMMGSSSGGALCPNGMTLASNCTLAPNAQAAGPLCPNGMTVASNCSTGSSTPAPSGPLAGGAGSIEDADFVSSLTGEEVGEDAEDVKVAGLDIDADDGSDIQLTAVRLDFTVGDADQDFEDYASEVSLWFEGEEVARADADDFNDGNNYDKTLSLSDGAVIKAGDTGQLVVAVTGIGNLDTNDVGETWTVEFESIRYEDASGAIITDNATGDINGVTRTFSFESFATSADTELKIAEKTGSAADAINKAHLINSHPTQATDNVKLLSFTLEAEGDSDIEIREFLADFIVTGATNVDGVIQGGTAPAARLIIDGEEYGTPSYAEDPDGLAVDVDEEIMWDDVNYTLKAGDKVDAYIEVDLNDTTGTGGIDDLDQADTILAQITATQRAALTDIDARDETGTQLAVADITGSATGEANPIYDVVFSFTSDGWETTSIARSDTATIDEAATFEIVLNIEANDGNIYIDDAPCIADNANGAAASDGFAWDVTNFADFDGGAATLTSCSVTVDNVTTNATNFQIDEGQIGKFTLAVTVTALDASDFARVTLEGIGWSEADEAGDRLFTGSLDDDFQSQSVFLNNRP